MGQFQMVISIGQIQKHSFLNQLHIWESTYLAETKCASWINSPANPTSKKKISEKLLMQDMHQAKTAFL